MIQINSQTIDLYQVLTYQGSIYAADMQPTFVKNKGGIMSNGKLMALYGRRFTSSMRLLGFIAILIFGVLSAFRQQPDNDVHDGHVDIEHLEEEAS